VARDFVLPDIGEGLVEAEIVRWHVTVGDVVTEEQVLVEVETAKAVVELPSPYAGTILRLAAGEGETIAVGDMLVVIGEADEVAPERPLPPAASPAPSPDAAAAPGTAHAATDRVKAMPVVRKLARDHGIDLATVTPTGPGGRVTRQDVEAVMAAEPAEPVRRTTAQAGEDRRVPFTRVRKTIAEHMVRAWTEIPHVTVFDRIDGTRLLDARSALARRLDRRIPLEAFLVKAVVPVLREFPEFNATVEDDAIVLRAACNVAVAVDTEEGLIVPVVHGADDRSIAQLADEVDRLAAAVKDRTASIDDLTGGTFTVSNIGALGGGYGTPIIPLGTTSILAVGRAEPTPVVGADGSVRSAPLIPLSLSYDHRVIDGGMGQRFLARLMENLEEPALFLA
jgi:pyruvate dehydrogenase E2 component (dihydrolipoamide acetyltransferase)